MVSEIKILENIFRKGPSYFTTLHKNNNSMYLNYETLYIENKLSQTFYKYAGYLCENKTNILAYYIEKKYNNNNYEELIERFIKYFTENRSSSEAIMFLINIVKIPNIMDYILGDQHDINDNLIKKSLFLCLLRCLNNMDDIKKLCELSIMSEERIYIFFCKIINGCIGRMYVDPISKKYKKYVDDDLLAIIFGISLYYGRGDNKINLNYLISDECPITWFEKKDMNISPTKRTQYFCLALQCIRVYYIPMRIHYYRLNNIISSFEFLDNDMIHNILLNYEVIMKSDIFNANNIYNFYATFYKSMNNIKFSICDIVYDFIRCVDFDAGDHKIIFPLFKEFLYNYKKYKLNIDYLYDLICVIDKLDILYNSEEDSYRFIKIILNTIIDYSKTDVDEMYKMNVKMQLYYILSRYIDSNKSDSIITDDEYMNCATILMNDTIDVSDILHDFESKKFKGKSKKIILAYIGMLKILSVFVRRDRVNKLLSESTMSIDAMSRIVMENMERLWKYKYDHKLFNIHDKRYELNKYIIDICMYYRSDKFLDKLIKDDAKYKYEKYKLLRKGLVIDMVKDEKKNRLNDFKDFLKSLEKHKTVEYKEDIPDEFLDPLTYIPIENPILLPNKVIVDYSVMEKHFITSNSNPFTREILTLNDLKEYNKTSEAQLIINKFKDDFVKWKDNNTIKNN